MKKFLLSILVLLLLSTSAYAEPTDSIKYFMNEPVSMFDFGMYQLEKDVDIYIREIYITSIMPMFKLGKLTILSYVHYYLDINRIEIRILLNDANKKLTKEDYKIISNKYISLIRLHYGILDGNIIESIDGRYLSGLFMHRGYKKVNENNNIYIELNNITNIIIITPLITAEAPLVGKEKDISYRDDKKDWNWKDIFRHKKSTYIDIQISQVAWYSRVAESGRRASSRINL